MPIATTLAWLMLGCSSSLPLPPKAEHPPDSYVDVPYPPPAALAETLPLRPARAGAVWIDGDWVFRGATYSWQRGGWFELPNGGRYAPSDVRYSVEGRILFAPGTWYGASHEVLPRPNRLLPALTPPNEFTSEVMTSR
ncbi:MAG TPA: hypothetical protein VIV60_31635 [Polyangiaceae bacterium]